MKVGQITVCVETRFRLWLLRCVPALLMVGGVWLANAALKRVFRFRLGRGRWQRVPLQITEVTIGVA